MCRGKLFAALPNCHVLEGDYFCHADYVGFLDFLAASSCEIAAVLLMPAMASLPSPGALGLVCTLLWGGGSMYLKTDKKKPKRS